jgi:hypothetical protein
MNGFHLNQLITDARALLFLLFFSSSLPGYSLALLNIFQALAQSPFEEKSVSDLQSSKKQVDSSTQKREGEKVWTYAESGGSVNPNDKAVVECAKDHVQDQETSPASHRVLWLKDDCGNKTTAAGKNQGETSGGIDSSDHCTTNDVRHRRNSVEMRKCVRVHGRVSTGYRSESRL